MNRAVLDFALFQAKLKVFRAKRHIDEAQKLFELYTNSDYCRIVVDRKSEDGSQIVRAVAETIPAHLVLSIGDTFHNLNSAMDYVMTGMMRAAGLSTKRISFPTNESRQQLRKSFMASPRGREPTNRRILKAFPAFVMMLFTKMKPYPGGKFLLWEITKADNIDKHNLIIPTVTITELQDVHFKNPGNNIVVYGLNITIGPRGFTDVAKYTGIDEIEILEKGKAISRIDFPDNFEVFAGAPVFPTLLNCVECIEGAIAMIESANFSCFVRPSIK